MKTLRQAFVAILTITVAVFLLLMVVGPATAQPVPFDQALRLRIELGRSLYVDMRTCMRHGSSAMLIQGMRDRASILEFTKGVCSVQIRQFLLVYMDWKPVDVDLLVQISAERELDGVLGLKP